MVARRVIEGEILGLLTYKYTLFPPFKDNIVRYWRRKSPEWLAVASRPLVLVFIEVE